MKAWLEDALRLVPEGSVEQNMFRSAFFFGLSRAIGSDAGSSTTSVADVIVHATNVIRQDFPLFKPRYDRRLPELPWPQPTASSRTLEADLLQAVTKTFLKLR